MTVEELIRTSIEQRAGGVPPLDLDAVVRRGRRRRAVSTTVTVVVAAAVVAAGTLGVLAGQRGDSRVEPIGPFDYANGLRVFKSPDDNIVHLGGAEFSVDALVDFDLSSTGTPAGLVYFSADQQPHLLAESGEIRDLGAGVDDEGISFYPTVRYDASGPMVAWSQWAGGATFTVTAYDLRADRAVDSIDVPCGGRCDKPLDAAVVGLDHGVVFISDGTATYGWTPGGDDLVPVLGRGAALHDVRNGTLLVDGPLPDRVPQLTDDVHWAMVREPGDARLSHDGRYLLDWSPVLRPIDPADPPIRLDVDPKGLIFFASFDTDGSVLVALSEPAQPISTIYDCALPAGSCEQIAELRTSSGDPQIGGYEE